MLSDSCDLKMPPKKPNPPSLLVYYLTKILIGNCFLGLFPRPAMAKYHKIDGLGPQKYILPHLWNPEV